DIVQCVDAGRKAVIAFRTQYSVSYVLRPGRTSTSAGLGLQLLAGTTSRSGPARKRSYASPIGLVPSDWSPGPDFARAACNTPRMASSPGLATQCSPDSFPYPARSAIIFKTALRATFPPVVSPLPLL